MNNSLKKLAGKSFLVISIDFEMFWGISSAEKFNSYGRRIELEWEAIPRILKLFEIYQISATWAIVGMLLCRNIAEWREFSAMLKVHNLIKKNPNLYLEDYVQSNQKLFFAVDLVEQIQNAKNQEIASHTFSHPIACGHPTSLKYFDDDCRLQNYVLNRIGVNPVSIIFPRNAINKDFINLAATYGIKTYRGNPLNWVYRNGDFISYGYAGRFMRKLDGYIPLTKTNIPAEIQHEINGVANVPASRFFMPLTGINLIDYFQINRIQAEMTQAAICGGVYHLWWHPHNFGGNVNRSILYLEKILQHFSRLRSSHGMESFSMKDFV